MFSRFCLNKNKGIFACLVQRCNAPSFPFYGQKVRMSRKVTFKPYQKPCYEGHDEMNMRINRPMSPHLTIIAPTLTAFTSIAQRISGAIMALYASLLSFGALFLHNGVDTYVTMIQSFDISRPLLFLIKLTLTIPFTFHYFNGIRFAAWFMGRWLTMKEIRDTSMKSFYLTGVFAVILALWK